MSKFEKARDESLSKIDFDLTEKEKASFKIGANWAKAWMDKATEEEIENLIEGLYDCRNPIVEKLSDTMTKISVCFECKSCKALTRWRKFNETT